LDTHKEEKIGREKIREKIGHPQELAINETTLQY
jgi:hypothetical protein